jgi:hypothetical protein
MAVAVSVNVLQTPDGTTFSGLANPCPVFLVGTANIQEVVSASAGQQAILPGVQSVITVKYNNGNDVLTGAYLVGQTVATLTTSINA